MRTATLRRPMEVLSLCPLPVGVVRWRSPSPSLTIVVKATFTLHCNGDASLAACQEPLWLDRGAPEGGRSEIDAATDFAPFKPRVDVLLTGHARAAASARAIPVRLGVDAFDKRFFAVATEPAVALPLADAYLRSAADPGAAVVRVKARAPWSPERVVFGADRLLDPAGLPIAPLPAGFDYRFFNAAPQDQQVDLQPATAVLALDGLLPGVPVRRARLPGSYPRVLCLPFMDDARRGNPAEVRMRCDTLWIDADRALCTLTWRGVMALPRDPLRLVVALERHGEARSWESLCGQLRGAARGHAVEASELSRPESAAATALGEALPGRLHAAGVYALASKHLPAAVRALGAGEEEGEEERTMVRRSPAALEGTLAADLRAVACSSGLPFVAAPAQVVAGRGVLVDNTVAAKLENALGPAMPFRAPGGAAQGVEAGRGWQGQERLAAQNLEATVVPVTGSAQAAARAVLPFGRAAARDLEATLAPFNDVLRGAASAALPFLSEPAEALEETLVPLGEAPRSAGESALPFRQTTSPGPMEDAGALPSCDRSSIGNELVRRDWPAASDHGNAMHSSFVQYPPSSHVQRPTSDPVMMPFEHYTVIKAEIWAASRELVLERYGIGELEWELNDQWHLEVVEQEAAEGWAQALSSSLRGWMRPAAITGTW